MAYAKITHDFKPYIWERKYWSRPITHTALFGLITWQTQKVSKTKIIRENFCGVCGQKKNHPNHTDFSNNPYHL